MSIQRYFSLKAHAQQIDYFPSVRLVFFSLVKQDIHQKLHFTCCCDMLAEKSRQFPLQPNQALHYDFNAMKARLSRRVGNKAYR